MKKKKKRKQIHYIVVIHWWHTKFSWCLVRSLHHNFATYGQVLFTKQHLKYHFSSNFGVLVSILCQTVRNQALKSMGFFPRGVWVMGYEVLFPENQLGELKNVWDLREYGLCEPCMCKPVHWKCLLELEREQGQKWMKNGKCIKNGYNIHLI